MEKAQENLKNYALANSAMAQENFINDSLKLDQIRMEQRKAKINSNLLSIMRVLLNLETWTIILMKHYDQTTHL